MASTVPMLLNRGIDLVTPPLLAEAGTLIDSLNYEMSADIGYRRWDGYERRDGYPTGSFSRWYSTTLGIIGYPFASILVGELLYKQLDVITYEPFGIVIAKSGGNRVDYVPLDSNDKLFIGNIIYSYNSGTYEPYAVATDSVDGRTLVPDPETYLTTTRSYQTIMRNLVTDAAAPIAGLFYSRDRSYEVINTAYTQISTPTTLIPGELVRYNGFRYIYAGFSAVPLLTNRRYAHLIPTGVADVPVNTDIVGVNTGTTKPTFTTLTTDESALGYMVWCGFPKNEAAGVTTDRGRVTLTPALHYNFTSGSYAASASGPPLGTYFVTNAGGGTQIMQGVVDQIVQQSGGWVGGTAVGNANFIPTFISTRRHLVAGDEIHSTFPVTGTSRIATVGSTITLAKLAGTGSLHRANTRYQWGTYNFYASTGSTSLFGTNGVFRAFTANPSGYSNIFTQADETLDNPKYLTFHAGTQLGLAFADGSFQLSVGGVPYNFEGVSGALEIGTGDDITGVLEGANDSSLIFGRRSIRRVTGTTDTTLALETVSANAGAFNYTCVNVGATPVFTGPTGVSTLQQVQQYGDFIGERATSTISTWLIPKLVPSDGGLELSGVACAFPVRNKQQYRLFLNTGDVVTVTFTTEGPKTMRGSYKQPTFKQLIPLAWGSSVADDGDEHVEVVWDRLLATTVGLSSETLPPDNRAYRLDSGWGFDGNTFEHWFDVTYTFVNNGGVATRVEKVRMYGMDYGVATLDLKASGIEKDFKLPFSSRVQPINMPYRTQLLSDNMEPVTGIVDHQNWGFGVKLRINGTKAPLLTTTEPSHICQVLVLHLDEQGAQDN